MWIKSLLKEKPKNMIYTRNFGILDPKNEPSALPKLVPEQFIVELWDEHYLEVYSTSSKFPNM